LTISKERYFRCSRSGALDEERYQWLVSELDKGQAEGKLMIVAAHLPLFLIGYNATNPYIDAKTLLEKLQTYPGYPNLILWIAGHRHCNVVTVHKSPDEAHPELGFYEVETSSLKDFPQQFRTSRLTAIAIILFRSLRQMLILQLKTGHSQRYRVLMPSQRRRYLSAISNISCLPALTMLSLLNN